MPASPLHYLKLLPSCWPLMPSGMSLSLYSLSFLVDLALLFFFFLALMLPLPFYKLASILWQLVLCGHERGNGCCIWADWAELTKKDNRVSSIKDVKNLGGAISGKVAGDRLFGWGWLRDGCSEMFSERAEEIRRNRIGQCPVEEEQWKEDQHGWKV